MMCDYKSYAWLFVELEKFCVFLLSCSPILIVAVLHGETATKLLALNFKNYQIAVPESWLTSYLIINRYCLISIIGVSRSTSSSSAASKMLGGFSGYSLFCNYSKCFLGRVFLSYHLLFCHIFYWPFWLAVFSGQVLGSRSYTEPSCSFSCCLFSVFSYPTIHLGGISYCNILCSSRACG